MCRMLGLIGQSPLPMGEALDAFYPLCTKGCIKPGMTPGHQDGWGISGFQEGRAVYFGRNAGGADQTAEEFQTAKNRAVKSQTPVLLAHFRKASGSPAGIANTHPFHYRDWIFAHNGFIHGAAASFSLIESSPLGDTDSERFFHWLLEQVHAETDPTSALCALLKKMREQLVYTSLNFLMSDGRELWAYRDFGEKRLEGGETLEDRQNYYTLFAATLPTGRVVCSEKLSSLAASWEPIGQRTLAVFSVEKTAPQLIQL